MKNPLIITLVLLSAIQVTVSRTSEELKVTLQHGGTLVGRYLNSFTGRGIKAFLGVPYAQPPLGELRFKPPQALPTWTGERQAVNDHPLCIQRDPFRRDEVLEGSEDCLYINVYVPQQPAVEKLPVMVFFHGGGWQCGSGQRHFYGPDFMMEHDVIYIGANFRLGPLGFLSTGQEDCPGNNGLKDQVMILEWIQEHIESFGGDRNEVTVFGESAGGASGTYHMMSPLSKGLFKRVISQSGTNLDAWAQPAHTGVASARAKKVGEMLDCPLQNDNWAAMLECLRAVSTEDITATFYNFFEWDTDPMIPFPPVVEPDLPGAFITKHPRDETAPHSLGIPWLTGITSEEGAMKSAPLINLATIKNDLLINWDRALSVSLYYNHHGLDEQRLMTKKINKFYFEHRKLMDETQQNLTNLYTDAWFLAGMDEYLKIRLNKGAKGKVGPTYVYYFNHKGAASFTEIFQGGRENYYGASHAEELQYLFPIGKDLFVSAVPTAEDLEMRRLLTKMWVNFAKTGNPTPDDDPVKWEPTESYPLKFLRIGNKDYANRPMVGMEKGLLDERAEFWASLKAHHAARGDPKDEL